MTKGQGQRSRSRSKVRCQGQRSDVKVRDQRSRSRLRSRSRWRSRSKVDAMPEPLMQRILIKKSRNHEFPDNARFRLCSIMIEMSYCRLRENSLERSLFIKNKTKKTVKRSRSKIKVRVQGQRSRSEVDAMPAMRIPPMLNFWEIRNFQTMHASASAR